MKKLLFAFVLLGFLRGLSRADIPPPRPNVVTVSNLGGFPGFTFSCSTSQENEPKKEFKPLKAKQEFPAFPPVAHLYVEDRSGKRVEFASLKFEYRGSNIAVSIQDVRPEGKTIKVRCKIEPASAMGGPPTSANSMPALPFMISGLSLGAVGLLIRKNRTPSGAA